MFGYSLYVWLMIDSAYKDSTNKLTQTLRHTNSKVTSLQGFILYGAKYLNHIVWYAVNLYCFNIP